MERNALLRKLLVTALTILTGVFGVQAASPGDDRPGPEIVRGSDGQGLAGVIIGPTNSEVQRVAQTRPKEPVVIRGPSTVDHNLPHAALPNSVIEDRLNRVEAAIEAERREVHGIVWIIGFATLAICVLGSGLLIVGRKS